MPRKPSLHRIPETQRFSVTLRGDQLKEIKKMAIDFETPEDEIVIQIIDFLIEKYRQGKAHEIIQK